MAWSCSRARSDSPRPARTPRSRDLRLLAGAAGLSALGDFTAIFPLILHVQRHTGSAIAVSALIVALWAQSFLPQVWQGALVGLDSLWALLPLMSVLGFGVAVSQPAEFALIPAAAGQGSDAARANGPIETARSSGFHRRRPVVGGALGAGGLLWLALVLNALSLGVVAAAALLLRARRRPEPVSAPTSGCAHPTDLCSSGADATSR